MRLELPTTKVTYKLPEILSTKEVQGIIRAAGNIKHKILLMVIYSAGLRVSEAVNLRTSDIDKDRMTLHIRNCKNRRDRYVILSPVMYEALREYWRFCKFTDYVFPGQKKNEPMSIGTAGTIFKKAKERAGVTKAGGIHSLRHAFATHMLEAGEDLFVIKRLLGHSSIHSTVRYLNFIPDRNTKVRSPIDYLDI
jgi:site-specific recombinase XerD